MASQSEDQAHSHPQPRTRPCPLPPPPTQTRRRTPTLQVEDRGGPEDQPYLTGDERLLVINVDEHVFSRAEQAHIICGAAVAKPQRGSSLLGHKEPRQDPFPSPPLHLLVHFSLHTKGPVPGVVLTWTHSPASSPVPYLGRPVEMDSRPNRGRTGSSPGNGWCTGPQQAGGQTGGYQ